MGSVLAGIVALALIVGFVVLRGGDDAPVAGEPAKTDGGSTSQAPVEPAARNASDAVKGYLEALAANNPEAALGFAQEQPAETSLLTAEVLRASTDAAPITEINVPEVTDQYAYQVPATYRMGSKKVSEKFNVSKQDDDTYKITDAVVDVDVSRIKNTDVPLSINGVEISDDETELSLFPGNYAFASGLKNLDYGDSELLIQSPSDYASTAELRLEITPEGKKAFIAASKQALDKCLKQKKLAPSGCPNTVGAPKSGAKYKKGSIKWKVSGNPFSGMDPRLDYDDPSLATASASLTFRYEATITQDGRSGKSKGNTYDYTKFVVDLTKDDPNATLE